MMLGVIGFLILDRLHLRLRPDEPAALPGIVLMAGAFATLLAHWGLIPLLHMSPRTPVMLGPALGALGSVMTGPLQTQPGSVIGFDLHSLGLDLFRPGLPAGTTPPGHEQTPGTD